MALWEEPPTAEPWEPAVPDESAVDEPEPPEPEPNGEED